MSLLNFFNSVVKKNQPEAQGSSLQKIILNQFPGVVESELTLLASIAGLMARVAYVDMVFTKEEREQMARQLAQKFPHYAVQSTGIVALAVNNMKELAGIENHLYSDEINKKMSVEDRYQLLCILFQVAASDGVADNYESEEIRIICKALLLTPNDYISARATVRKQLGALKN